MPSLAAQLEQVLERYEQELAVLERLQGEVLELVSVVVAEEQAEQELVELGHTLVAQLPLVVAWLVVYMLPVGLAAVVLVRAYPMNFP